jgi:arginine N-succinyltransferase
MFLRPVKKGDLPELMTLAREAGVGLTTLPADEDVLARRIRDSEKAFAALAEKPAGESYLFVLEDPVNGKLAGTTGITSKVGGFEPFWAYRLETVIHESPSLGVRKEVKVLHLHKDHDGPAEIGTLFLSPQYRKKGLGRLLSLGRFLFLAEHRRFFDPVIIAEMRGVINKRGQSPFWEGLGRHFFGIEFEQADKMVTRGKGFIAELMPKHPIYIPILPKAAQNCVGKVHTNTKPALALLKGEGFSETGMVDIFEGGPIVSCEAEKIRTVSESRKTRVVEVVKKELDSTPYLLSNTAAQTFRVCLGSVHLVPGKGVSIEQKAAQRLGLKPGDAIRVAPLHPGGHVLEVAS